MAHYSHLHNSYVSFRKLKSFIQHEETPGEGNVSLLSLQRDLIAIKSMLFVYNFVVTLSHFLTLRS